ncbi:uncharacterized protein GLRG_06049 [Colletotrichum graminicola M1.001]|uniref:Nephrocystin 3-like N-terminal domain-containing protein n=1 Tax=Colletotrichum graminicola (strain M1.001 / M2 / FGSC 10212) TaxID=645133 RepID=E3QJ67_COLGM|nr:uncharacterized protein GLRG_06049 [Colletotrichum graminicola M1.001]EFQ30905.1 hypothetical protein GLRG_06049 [Colletotrichum graminicola M1.001]
MARDIWSESGLWYSLLGLVVPIIVCLAVVAASRWAVSPAPTVMRPPKPLKSLTFRVDDIPVDHIDDLDRNIQSIAERDADLRAAAFTRRSLGHSDNKHVCATVTATTTLSGNDLCSRLTRAGKGFPYSYSCDFDGITPLYEDTNGAAVDIIAVPGLGSHPLGSWKSPRNDDVWLRDFLPKDVPNIRVLIYGYDTTLPGSRSKQSIEDLGGILVERLVAFRARDGTTRRPLIFIGHSLGGLLIKEALIRARNSRDVDIADLAKACYALLFFGVPNLGLRNEQLRTMVRGQPNDALVHDLIVDNDSEASTFLKRLADDFAEKCKDHYRVMSFFERMLSPTVQRDDEGNWRKTGPASLLVTQKSATATGLVAVADEDNIALNADHSGIVKYSSRGQGDYPTVRRRLMDCVERAILDVPRRFTEHSFENLYSKRVEDCMRSLAFQEIDGRQNGIDAAAAGTCQWLPSHETLTAWIRQHRGLLWIKGKPGAGKSTLMKYALEKVPHLYETQPLVLSFFFHGRGHELQKSQLGLFRSLLHQLLNHVPGALSDLIDTFGVNVKTVGEAGKEWQWHVPMLQVFFQSSLSKILKQRAVLVFIDALDECGEEPAVQLIEFFKKTLSGLSLEDSQFSICFSCRHYPIVELEGGSTIHIDQENGRDIDTYVRTHLPSEQDSDIRSLLSQRAQGVFMWAHLVVNRVLQMKRNGKSPSKIKREVERVPQQLDDLYYDLLQGLNSEDRPETLRLVQWVCFSIRPLTMYELPWAMTIDPDIPTQTLDDCEQSDEFISKDDMHRRVTSLSCGLAEVASSDKSHVIQFIHQSVRDFFIERGLSALDDTIETARLVAPTVNCRLFFQCISYFKMTVSSDAGGFCIDHAFKFPFLRYAVLYWASHAKRGEAADVYAKDILESFGWPSRSLVDKLVKAIEFFESDAWFRKVRAASLVHIASLHDLQGLLQIIMEHTEAHIDAKSDGGGTPLSFAAEKGNDAIVKMLLDTGKVDVNSKDNNGWTPLSFAAEKGSEVIVKMLLDTGKVNTSSEDNYGWTPLSWAAMNGHDGVVKMLLDTGKVKVTLRDINSLTLLSSAAIDGYKKSLKILLNTGKVEVDSRDTNGRTPLSWAAGNGQEEIVKILVDTGKVDVDSRDDDGWTPLSWAATNGQEEIVKTLVDTGKVDVNSRHNDGSTPLSWAATNGHEGIVKILVDTGKVDMDSRDINGWTPLSWAAYVFVQGPYLVKTLLSRAASFGHEGVVKMLLDTGMASINSRCKGGRTSLSWAAACGFDEVVKMLLDADGIDVNTRDNAGRTPISAAARKGRVKVVASLCDKRTTDVNLEDKGGFTPFMRAVWRGHKEVADVLLQTGRLSYRHCMDGLCYQAFWTLNPEELDQFMVDADLDMGEDFFGLRELFCDLSIP